MKPRFSGLPFIQAYVFICKREEGIEGPFPDTPGQAEPPVEKVAADTETCFNLCHFGWVCSNCPGG